MNANIQRMNLCYCKSYLESIWAANMGSYLGDPMLGFDGISGYLCHQCVKVPISAQQFLRNHCFDSTTSGRRKKNAARPQMTVKRQRLNGNWSYETDRRWVLCFVASGPTILRPAASSSLSTECWDQNIGTLFNFDLPPWPEHKKSCELRSHTSGSTSAIYQS